MTLAFVGKLLRKLRKQQTASRRRQTSARLEAGLILGLLVMSSGIGLCAGNRACFTVIDLVCGDGVQHPYEGCDDGNTVSGDGRRMFC